MYRIHSKRPLLYIYVYLYFYNSSATLRARFLLFLNLPIYNMGRQATQIKTHLVAKLWPRESLTCTMWNEPGCFSTWTICPTRPMLWPPVIMHMLPDNNKPTYSNWVINAGLPAKPISINTTAYSCTKQTVQSLIVCFKSNKSLTGLQMSHKNQTLLLETINSVIPCRINVTMSQHQN